MFVAGLTGGIGSGKSTFALLLAERGAQIIDADELGREELQPGKPAWQSVVDQFGREVLAEGALDIDRAKLASIVFGDGDKLAALNAIVHPRIFARIAESLERLQASDAIVIIDAALIVEAGLVRDLDALIVVAAPEVARLERLHRTRGMTPDEARARMRRQAPEAELLARADIVVANAGSLDDLQREADRVWAELESRSGHA